MFNLTLCVVLSFNSISLDLAKDLVFNDNYQEASKILKQINPTPSSYNEINYYSLICHFRLNQKELALKDVTILNNSFYIFSRRQQAMIFLMTQEISQWQKDGSLDDIMRDMLKSKDKLSAGKADDDTLKTQKDIVRKLDKFIEEAESSAKGSMAQIPGGNGNKGNPSQLPLLDSLVGGDKGKGLILENKMKQITESWGALPPAGRERVVKEITREIPPKYKELVDSYFKSLNKFKEK